MAGVGSKWLRLPMLGIASLFVMKLDMVNLNQVRELQSNHSSRTGSTRVERKTYAWNAITMAENLASILGRMDTEDDQSWQEDDLHYSNRDIVHLLDWEEGSLQGLLDPNVTQRSAYYSCKAPPGVSPSCCLGTFSNGGATQVQHRHRCAKPMQNLDEVRQHTVQFFQQNPVEEGALLCDICRIVDLAKRDNLTIALMGDSMHNQIYDGLSCELERRNYNVTKTSINLNTGNDPTWIYRRYTRSEFLHIRSPTWSPDEVVTIQFHRIYLLPLVTGDVATLTAQADVLVLGVGLHYWYDNKTPHLFRRRDYYTDAMKDLFLNVTRQGHVKLLAHRETSAQHFDADGGEFSLWYPHREKLQKSCQPTRYNDSSVLWREKVIQRAAQLSSHELVMAGPNMMPPQTDRPEVVVLPYFNFTSQHHNMHPLDPKGMDDCTHYCSSPYVYFPLWRSLRFAMDRQFATS